MLGGCQSRAGSQRWGKNAQRPAEAKRPGGLPGRGPLSAPLPGRSGLCVQPGPYPGTSPPLSFHCTGVEGRPGAQISLTHPPFPQLGVHMPGLAAVAGAVVGRQLAGGMKTSFDDNIRPLAPGTEAGSLLVRGMALDGKVILRVERPVNATTVLFTWQDRTQRLTCATGSWLAALGTAWETFTERARCGYSQVAAQLGAGLGRRDGGASSRRGKAGTGAAQGVRAQGQRFVVSEPQTPPESLQNTLDSPRKVSACMEPVSPGAHGSPWHPPTSQVL